MTTNSQVDAAQGIDNASKTQSSQNVTLQTFCLSVGQQANVDLSKFPALQSIGVEINNGLGMARDHAQLYLNTIRPSIETNLANISNYYVLHNSVLTSLPPGSSEKDWIAALNALKDQSTDFKNNAAGVATSLADLRDKLSSDVAAFSKVVSDLNTAVGGDNGVLANISSQLGALQSKIDGAISGIVLSSLAIVGGIFITLVGAVADFVTAGTSTPLVLGGIAVVAAGVGGVVASSLALKGLYDAQSTLLMQQQNLKSEVAQASGMSNGYTAFSNQIRAAAQAALDMQSAWEFLGADLGSLASDLDKGITSVGVVRTLFLNASNSMIKTVQQDTDTIRGQMAGLTNRTAPAGQSIGDFTVSVAQTVAA
jgi:non-hemolytic enterotoxin B/C